MGEFGGDSTSISEGKVMEWFCAESFLPGVFVKWVGNYGFISEEVDAATAACFAHFTFKRSGGKHMVTDLQGTCSGSSFTLTDPQVLSREREFGRADLGEDG